MIDSRTIALEYIKKEDFLGSYRGMRYRLAKKEETIREEEETVIEVILWPEPYNFFKTEEEKKQRRCFPFSPQGKEEAVQWMNEQYREQRPLWDSALC